jgi:hypothetical protein
VESGAVEQGGVDEVDEFELSKEEQAARVEARMADAKAKRVEEQQRRKEAAAEAKRSFGPRRISLDDTGFMALKALMIERGMPAEELSGATTKEGLREAALQWPGCDTLKIDWVEQQSRV